MNNGMAQTNRSFSMQFNLAEGNHVEITASTPEDLQDVLDVAEDFLELAGDHITSYTVGTLEDSESVIEALRAAVSNGQASVLLSKHDFLHLGGLIENYRSHGYGTISKTRTTEPPLEERRYTEIAEVYKSAEDALFPSA